MHKIGYITAELSLLCQEYKTAEEPKASKLGEEIRKLVESLTESFDQVRNDGVFFAGDLDDHHHEYETLYPGDERKEHDDADSSEYDWVTIKGTHVPLDDEGNMTGEVAKKIKATSKGPAKSGKRELNLSDSTKPKRTDYDLDPADGHQEFISKNVDKLMPIFEEKGMDGVKEEWLKARLQNATGNLRRISDQETDEILQNGIDKGVASMWITEYDPGVKEKLAHQLTKNSEIHNAALNVMYKNYQYHCKAQGKEALPFEDFLVTPVKMYRGGSGKEHKKALAFSSYTFDRAAAEKFKASNEGHGRATDDGVIYEAEIRPIDTFGSLNTSGEMEIFVPGFIAPNGRFDADEESEGDSSSKNHGNTKLPYGLCRKYGIEVQNGWTPREAWEALEGKGVSAAEEYKKLRERGKAEQKTAVSPERHTAAKKSCIERQTEVAQQTKELNRKIIDATNRRIDTEFGPLSRAKSELLQAERGSVEAKKRKDLIAGRTKEELESEVDALYKRVREAQELNEKLYDRPERGTPEREAWNAWCEQHGGRSEIIKKIDAELLSKDGALEKYNALSNILNNDYDRYGPDGGYKEASRKVRGVKKKIAGYEKEVQDAEAEVEEYKRQIAEAKESLKPVRQEYYDSVKERFPTFDDCKTVEDIAERLSAEGAFDGDDIVCDFGHKVSLDTAKATAKSFVDYINKVPFMKGHCGRLVIEDMTAEDAGVYGYSQRGKGVRLNNRFYGDEQKFEESWQRCMTDKFHPPGLTKESVVQHEYSHQMDDYMSDALKLHSGNFSTLVMNEVMSKLGMSRDECKRAVSGYSVNNKSGGDVEWFAEAMSEYTGSANPRPVAVAVGECVMKYAQQLQTQRHDAADDDGRWVTTENDHRVHINEEGVPDKGNPYVLATMRGEGPNPKSREELVRNRLRKRSRQVKALFQNLEDAERDEEVAYDERNKADNALRRLNLQRKIVANDKKMLADLGYGEGDKEVMERDLEELKSEMDSILQGRSKWSLQDEEKKSFTEVEAKYNKLDFAIKSYDECYGPDAFSEEKVSQAEEHAAKARQRAHDATVRREKAHKEAHAVSGKLDQERFLTSDERSSAIQEIQHSSIWDGMTESAKTSAFESLQNAPDAQLLLLQKTAGHVRIMDGEGRVSPSGADSFYSKSTGTIVMSAEDMQKPSILWHEYGHYLDDPDQSDCYSHKKRNLSSDTEYRSSLSQALYDESAMHSKESAADMNKLLQESGVEDYTIEESPYGHYLIVKNSEGGMIEDAYDTAFFKIASAVDSQFNKFQFSDSEYDDYLRSIGCPLSSEEPKYGDYIEFYYTPKRRLLREREKHKGAREEYNRLHMEYRNKREAAIAKNPDEYYDKTREYEERCRQREKMIGPVSDIICGMFNGRGPWVCGGHSSDYYSRSTAPYTEAVANYHQMRMMGWTEGLNLLKSIAPSVHNSLEKAYDEWLWRNVDL